MADGSERPKARRSNVVAAAQKQVRCAELAGLLAAGHTIASASEAMRLTYHAAYGLVRDPEGRAMVLALANAIRSEVLALATARLEAGTDIAVDVLLDKAQNARNDRDQINAAIAILDRAGLHAKRGASGHGADVDRMSDAELEEALPVAMATLRAAREAAERAQVTIEIESVAHEPEETADDE